MSSVVNLHKSFVEHSMLFNMTIRVSTVNPADNNITITNGGSGHIQYTDSKTGVPEEMLVDVVSDMIANATHHAKKMKDGEHVVAKLIHDLKFTIV